MAISFDECRVLLDQFKRAHPEFLMRGEVHGVQVLQLNDKPVVVVLVSEAIREDSLRADEKLPHSFTYEFEDRKGLASVEVRVSPIAKAHTGVLCHPGDPASGDPQSYFGTLGWNLYLNNVLVCLSNWHVMCARGNDTPIGWNITVNGSVEATLYAFQALYPTGNFWDYALAQYIQPTDAAGVMRQCQDGGLLPYPGNLSRVGSVGVGDGAQYYKVGARSPTCRTGTLVAVGDRDIKYDDGVIRSFQSQLIFSKMTDAGDSGAVIVRQADTSVTGLNFAGNDTETIANPIYLAGWRRGGSIRFDGGADIPMFTGNPVLAPASGSSAILTDAAGLAVEPRMLTDQPRSLASFHPFDIPPLSAGLLFLGNATRITPRGGQPYYVGPPPPPPIRPNVQVQVVTASTTGTAQGWTYETVLYFG